MAQPSFPYKKVSKVVYQKPSSVVTEDSVYWNKLGVKNDYNNYNLFSVKIHAIIN